MGLSYSEYNDEWKMFEARIHALKCVLRDLVKECEDADHWIRHTDAFENAKNLMVEEDGVQT